MAASRAVRRVAAIDLGATSGRVTVAVVGPGRLDLEEVHRFANTPVQAADGSLRWDVACLWDEIVTGLRAAGPVDAVGVDSWAVDYALLDEAGDLLGQPYCYRDDRTQRVADEVRSRVGEAELYRVTGLQHLPFNTLFQLATEPDLGSAAAMLMLPDLFGFWLTGSLGAEATNASTTQLFDATTRDWSPDLARTAGVPTRLLAPIRRPGERIGTLLPDLARRCGQSPRTPVVAVGSHDTASAVVGTPLVDRDHAAYISSGTWSLAGLELDHPVLTDEARAANFTNEAGVDDTVRFLRNVTGLWILTETMRSWGRDDLDVLLAEAAIAPAFGPVFDADDPAFLPPGDMSSRIADACRRTGQAPPDEPGTVVRSILESLALAYRRAVRTAADLAGRDLEVVHVVGGGSQNELLTQLTADACGLPVLAGPVEATTLGNALVQVRALGPVDGLELDDLDDLRALVRATHPPRRVEPAVSGSAADDRSWGEAESRLTAPPARRAT